MLPIADAIGILLITLALLMIIRNLGVRTAWRVAVAKTKGRIR